MYLKYVTQTHRELPIGKDCANILHKEIRRPWEHRESSRHMANVAIMFDRP